MDVGSAHGSPAEVAPGSVFRMSTASSSASGSSVLTLEEGLPPDTVLGHLHRRKQRTAPGEIVGEACSKDDGLSPWKKRIAAYTALARPMSVADIGFCTVDSVWSDSADIIKVWLGDAVERSE